MTDITAPVWSESRKKWMCYDDRVIDEVLASSNFHVPDYNYAPLEKKLSLDFEYTKAIISQFPLAAEGSHHEGIRARMKADINAGHKQAVSVFGSQLQQQIDSLPTSADCFDFVPVLLPPILASNLVFAGLTMEQCEGYADLTQMLDDGQPIKSRLRREALARDIGASLNEADRFYQLALISVGVNALASSVMHSFVKILTNSHFDALKASRYFAASGIKQIERICQKDTQIANQRIQSGDRVRLYLAAYENTALTSAQKSGKFFLSGTNHSCLGMSYSVSVWKVLVQTFSRNFSSLSLKSFEYRDDDGVFNSLRSIEVGFSK
jgi:hypothetical protein